MGESTAARPVMRAGSPQDVVRAAAAMSELSAATGADPDAPPLTLEQLKVVYVNAVLALCGGNKTNAARALGINRRLIYRLLARAAG